MYIVYIYEHTQTTVNIKCDSSTNQLGCEREMEGDLSLSLFIWGSMDMIHIGLIDIGPIANGCLNSFSVTEASQPQEPIVKLND